MNEKSQIFKFCEKIDWYSPGSCDHMLDGLSKYWPLIGQCSRHPGFSLAVSDHESSAKWVLVPRDISAQLPYYFQAYFTRFFQERIPLILLPSDVIRKIRSLCCQKVFLSTKVEMCFLAHHRTGQGKKVILIKKTRCWDGKWKSKSNCAPD